ncbi:MAG: hypothetical protein ACPGUD_02300 [Parashewanella sp.]
MKHEFDSKMILSIASDCSESMLSWTRVALTIHAHPTLHESVDLVAETYEGSITDLPHPKAKKKK